MVAGQAGPIFISYSRRDDAAMRRIAFFLRDQNFKVWVDNEKLVPGTPIWEAEIEKAISSAMAVIVVLSPASKGSEWVRREIAYAEQYEKRVFPVLVDGDPDSAIPIRLITRQYVDFRPDEDAGLESLRTSLNHYREGKQTLEMKRPAVKARPLTEGLEEKPAQSPPPEVHAPGIQIPGQAIFLGIFILAAVTAWAAYRMLSTQFSSKDNPPATETVDSVPGIPAGPDKAGEYLEDIQIRASDTFDNPAGAGWEIRNGRILDGTLEITGGGGDLFAGVQRKAIFGAGQGVILDFSFSPASLSEIMWSYGIWNSDAYRRFGLYAGDNTVELNLYEGVNDLGGANLMEGFTLEPDVVHTMLMAILSDGEFLLAVWNPDSPSQFLDYTDKRNGSWKGLDWTFWVQVNTGTLRIDNFREIIFSGVK